MPKNIQKPYILVTFDEMHQKIFVDGAKFFLGKQTLTHIKFEKILSKYLYSFSDMYF